MEYRTLGTSELKVSELAFGAWAIGGWLWGGADARDAIKAIETAVDHGMTTIDTAAVYGFGLSEELVGKAVKGKRSRTQILTKFGMVWDEKKGKFYFSTKDNDGKNIDIYAYSSKERVLADCDMSLKRLGTDYIDLYQIHWPDATTPIAETMEALQILIRQGKIRAGAVSNYSAGQMDEALKTYHIASNQIPYSMVNRAIEKESVPFCMKNNIGILAYSPLQRGLLTGKFNKDHNFSDGDSRPDTPFYKEPNLSRIIEFTEKLKVTAGDLNVTLTQLVLNWTKEQPGITCVLAGARNPQQVLDNVKAVDFRIPQDLMTEINNLVAGLRLEIKN